MSYGSILGGLSNFASSGLGQTVIGAGLGYGADRLMGGQGGVGAVLGGLGGGLNAWDSGAGLLEGGNFADSAIGGLWGGTPTQNKAQELYSQQYMGIDPSYLTPDVESALSQGYKNLATPDTGLLGNIQDFGSKYKDTVDLGTDLFKGYGDYKTGLAQQENYQNEMNVRNQLLARDLAEADFKKQAQLATQANIDSAFNQSQFSKPSNYYTT